MSCLNSKIKLITSSINSLVFLIDKLHVKINNTNPITDFLIYKSNNDLLITIDNKSYNSLRVSCGIVCGVNNSEDEYLDISSDEI